MTFTSEPRERLEFELNFSRHQGTLMSELINGTASTANQKPAR